MFLRKKDKEDVTQIQDLYPLPPGSPIICGGDNIYAVYNALNMCILMYDGFKKVQPKKAKNLKPIYDIWIKLVHDLEPYALIIECESDSI